jgi:Flp pilus assembly protein TadD
VDIKRQLAVALVGAGVGLTGCQSAPFAGLAFWNKGESASVAAATPDVSKHLSQQMASGAKPAGKATAALGGQRPVEKDNFLVASWKKTTAAVTGTLTPKATTEESTSDPLRLDQPTKKVGPEVHVAAARMLENNGKAAEAQAQYQKALQTAPNDLNALIGLARLHDRQGNGQQAIEMYQKAIAANPQSSLAYNDLGLCYARQQQHQAALQALNKAVELQPTSTKYRNNLAAVLVDLGQTDEALNHLTAGNAPAVAHYNLGYLLQQKGDRENALRNFQHALALDPALAPARDMISQLSAPAHPVAMQPSSKWAPQATAHSEAVPAPPPTTQRLSHDVKATSESDVTTALYSEDAAATPVSTVAPAVATTPKAPASFHIGDDEEQVAEVSTLQRHWDTDWPLISGNAPAGSVYPLPVAQ